MGTTKSLVVFITHVVNDFVCVNMMWAFGSSLCNYVLHAFGFVLTLLFRFLHLVDAKGMATAHPLSPDAGTQRNKLCDSEVDGFREELANFLFWSEDFHGGSEETEGEADCSVSSMENVSEENEKREEEIGCSVLMGTHFGVQDDSMKTDCSVSKEIEFHVNGDSMDGGTEEDGDVFMESDSVNFVVHEVKNEIEGEAEGFASMETNLDVHEDVEELDEDEIKTSTFMENSSDLNEDSRKREEEVLEGDSNAHEDVNKNEENETGCSVSMENISIVNEDEADCSISMENMSGANEDALGFDENEKKEGESNFHVDGMKREVKEEEEGEEIDGAIFAETDSVTATSKCQYLSEKDISGFMEEPTTLRFSFREFYMGPDVSTVSDTSYANTEIIADKEFSEFGSEKDYLAHEYTDYSVQEQGSPPSSHVPLCFESEPFGGIDSSDEDYFLYNENSLTSDSESESSSSSGLIWGGCDKMNDGSMDFRFLGGKSGGEAFEPEILKLMMREEKPSSGDGEVLEFGVHGMCSEDEYVEMEPCLKGLTLKFLDAHRFGRKDATKDLVKDHKEGSQNEEKVFENGLDKSGETRWEDELSESDDDDDDDLEWEHDDLVEQLKLELRNSRQGGLATILEEVEEEELEEVEEEEEEERVSPKVDEDLKPLKIEEKLEYKDHIDEIGKVYKSYAERMKKLDILNFQTMHALGLLQLKDPLKLISIQKSTFQDAKPAISQNLWPRKASKNTKDPMMKIVHELQRDLELVYVGQVCLSWEILCWQHMKALELQQYDSQGSHRYNHVAGEFQLFQVLVQRFIENEPFQGPRIQNYVKNRCVIRNLLQVPAIKDDNGKGGGEEDAIASGKLAEIIKDSMRVFWEFVRADKEYGNVILKVYQQHKVDLKDPVISGLLVAIRAQQQKKERKLKDIVRTGNCIVKKFQKHHEDKLDHEQLVAQVGLRLISRVANMSKLRKEQLLWCNEKLHRINFLSRKIVRVEPSFLLFPC